MLMEKEIPRKHFQKSNIYFKIFQHFISYISTFNKIHPQYVGRLYNFISNFFGYLGFLFMHLNRKLK